MCPFLTPPPPPGLVGADVEADPLVLNQLFHHLLAPGGNWRKLPFQTASDAVIHVRWFQHVKTPDPANRARRLLLRAEIAISSFFCGFWAQPSLKVVSTDRSSCVQQAQVGVGRTPRCKQQPITCLGGDSLLPDDVHVRRQQHICCEEHVSAGFKTHTTTSGSLHIQ